MGEVSGPANRRVDPGVFYISVGISVLFVLWGVLFTQSLSNAATAVLTFLISNFGWVFVISTFGFLVFVVFLAFSRYGRIRLGGDDERPEFNTFSWVAMMFSVGMGIGLMFYGVAEPISHFSDPPHGLARPETEGAAQVAMEYSLFHWALHPWAIYAVVGLSLAYFTFRKGRRNLISSAFYPILGDRVDGPIGKAIDVLAIFATLFGTATSLGLGALQINGGLNYLSSAIPNTNWVAIAIIALMTVAFIVSAISGVHRGIQWLSNTNMVLAVLLVVFLLFVGPTVFILNNFVESIGGYFSRLVPMGFRTAAFGDAQWLAAWTIFYWAWWISWTPFVGTFIARISRGRTVREFVFGVLVVPSIVTFVWFGVLGGAALNLELGGNPGIVDAVSEDAAVALFATLNEFPLAAVMSGIAVILVALFFISGADAGAIVMGMLSCRGTLEPSKAIVVVWGSLAGAAAAICLAAGGSDPLSGLQTAAILSAAPFVLVMIAMCYSLMKALRAETLPGIAPGPPEPERAATRSSGAPAPQQTSALDPEDRG